MKRFLPKIKIHTIRCDTLILYIYIYRKREREKKVKLKQSNMEHCKGYYCHCAIT